MCTPDLDYMVESNISAPILNCLPQNPENPIVELPAIPTLNASIPSNASIASIASNDLIVSNASNASNASKAEESQAEVTEDADAEADEGSESESESESESCELVEDQFQSSFVVSTENGESLQFLSFIDNGEKKVTMSMNGNITLPVDILSSYLDEIDKSLTQAQAAAADAAEEADYTDPMIPVIVNYLLTFIVILLYSGTVVYGLTIAMNAPL